jgi:threonine/homoserine/homoserine lactone efflux protein
VDIFVSFVSSSCVFFLIWLGIKAIQIWTELEDLKKLTEREATA